MTLMGTLIYKIKLKAELLLRQGQGEKQALLTFLLAPTYPPSPPPSPTSCSSKEPGPNHCTPLPSVQAPQPRTLHKCQTYQWA